MSQAASGRPPCTATEAVIMPVKARPPKGRKPVFHEALALFAELNAVPLRSRSGDAFKAKDRRLARMLGLGGQWLCSGASVTDGRRLRSAGMTGPTYADHQRVRAVREALLQAVAEETAKGIHNMGTL
jgi:hypothetical protein